MRKGKKHKRKNNQQNKYSINDMYEEDFYFVAGYTSSGIPYGVTLEEAEEDGMYLQEDQKNDGIKDEKLPF